MEAYLTFHLESIDAEREESLAGLVTGIEDILAPHLKKKCPLAHDEDDSVCEHLAKTGHYVQELLRLGLWPLQDFIDNETIENVSKQITKFNNYTLRGNPRPGKRCIRAEIDCKQALEDLNQTELEDISGLCLNCVKKGMVTVEEGNCQADSLVLCKG